MASFSPWPVGHQAITHGGNEFPPFSRERNEEREREQGSNSRRNGVEPIPIIYSETLNGPGRSSFLFYYCWPCFFLLFIFLPAHIYLRIMLAASISVSECALQISPGLGKCFLADFHSLPPLFTQPCMRLPCASVIVCNLQFNYPGCLLHASKRNSRWNISCSYLPFLHWDRVASARLERIQIRDELFHNKKQCSPSYPSPVIYLSVCEHYRARKNIFKPRKYVDVLTESQLHCIFLKLSLANRSLSSIHFCAKGLNNHNDILRNWEIPHIFPSSSDHTCVHGRTCIRCCT